MRTENFDLDSNMEEQQSPQDEPPKKKTLTLFGKKINVPASSSPVIDFTVDAPPSTDTPTDTSPSPSPSTSPSPSSSSNEVQVLKLRLHLMEQKVKQLTESNEKLSTQLKAQSYHFEALQKEKDNLHALFMKDHERLLEYEKENDVLRYKLDLVEKYADTTTRRPSYSPPPLHHQSPYSPRSHSPIQRHWGPDDRRRSYDDHGRRYDRDDRRDDRDRSRERLDDRGRSRDRRDDRNRSRDRDMRDDRDRVYEDRDRGRDRDERDRERDIMTVAINSLLPDYQPFIPDMLLPSPVPSPSPRGSVFNRLGASTDLPLPSLPSPPLPQEGDEGGQEEGEIEQSAELARAAALDARLDLPLDALTKKSKMEKKNMNKGIPKNPNQKRALCVYYLEKGVCKNRGACKFSHAVNKRAKVEM